METIYRKYTYGHSVFAINNGVAIEVTKAENKTVGRKMQVIKNPSVIRSLFDNAICEDATSEEFVRATDEFTLALSECEYFFDEILSEDDEQLIPQT